MEIKNAQIKSTMLGREDHGIIEDKWFNLREFFTSHQN